MARNIEFDYKTNLNNIGLTSGNFNICYNIFKNVLGSAYDNKLYIDIISNSRLELRLKKVNSATDYTQLTTIADKLDNYIINFGNNNYELVVNWVIDGDDLIIKLATELPDNYDIKDELWISQIVANPVEGIVSLNEDLNNDEKDIKLRGPNFNIDIDIGNKDSTIYKTWDDLLSTNTSTISKILENSLSSSFNQSIELDNIDYSNYDNFVHFGSATERLKNFHYKLELIELYDSQISSISASVGSGDFVGRSESVATYNKFLDRRDKVTNTFDGYEKYLYYQSSSAIPSDSSSGYGIIYETTWPKTGGWGNYSLLSVTASAAIAWYNEQLTRATDYDLNNVHGLINTLPQYLLATDFSSSTSVSFDISIGDVSPTKQHTNYNGEYLTFVYMVGQYFDEYWNYIKSIKDINNRDNINSIATELLDDVLQSLGLSLEGNSKAINELWDYYAGYNTSAGTYLQTGSLDNPLYSISKKNYVGEINNRLLNNLPFLYKTKGSQRSIRALLNCFGVPNTLLKIKEYGGPKVGEAQFYEYNYALDFEEGNDSYVTSSYTTVPSSIELRFSPTSTSTQTLLNTDFTNGWVLSIQPSASSTVRGYLELSSSVGSLTSSYLPLVVDEDNFYNVLISSGISGTRLSTKIAKHGKIFYESTVVDTDTGWEIPWNNLSDNLYIGTNFTGSIQEFRMWDVELDENDFDEHVKWKKSTYTTVGNAYDNLICRYTFNVNRNHNTITSITDSRPNRLATLNTGLCVNFPDEINYTGYQQLQSAVAPNIISKWVNNKVRIESSSLDSNSLFYDRINTKYEYDEAPLDSNKVGIYFSPTNVIDEDIIATYGAHDFDNYVGDPADLFNESYTELDSLNNSYWKKYTKANSFNDYLRYINIVDNVLFTTIKKFLPARVKKSIGILVEPHILNRSKNKILRENPIVSDLTKRTTINAGDYVTTADYLTKGVTITTNTTTTTINGSLSNLSTNIITEDILDGTDGILFKTIASEQESVGYIVNSITGKKEWVLPIVKDRDYIYKGAIQDNTTTPNKEEAVIVYVSNPNKLIVPDDEGNSKLEIK